VLEGKSAVNNAAFSPDGKRIITANGNLLSTTGIACLWDAQSGLLLSVLEGHEGPVNYATFSPDGKQVMTISDDNTARVWQIFPTTQALIDYANQIVPRCLTPEQRKQYFLQPDPSDDLIKEGEQLAKQGNIKAATAKFKEAKAMAPCHKFLNFPEDKAR
jgi:WD40 repeat protein